MILLHLLLILPLGIVYGTGYLLTSIGKSPAQKGALQGAWLRRYFLRLGPLYIKIGQILATRSDLLSKEAIAELRTLQDDVPPVAGHKIRALLEAHYGRPLETVFKDFSPESIASASIAQVHAAVLATGEKVAVKVVKPGVKTRLERNLTALQWVVNATHFLVPPLRQLNAPDRVREVATLLRSQTDMVEEARNQEALYENFKQHQYVRIPKLYAAFCGPQVLVMEFVEGIRGKDFANVDLPPEQLARRLQDTVYTMLYMHGVCHGDPHPGNIFFTKDGTYIFVDFGITVYMTEDEKWGLSSFYYACIRQEWDNAIERFTRHFVTKKEGITGREAEYREALGAVLRRHFDTVRNQWSTSEFFRDINEVLKKFGAQYVTNFTKAELALTSCEGFANQIDPTIDVWENARGFSDRFSPFMNDTVRATFDQHYAQLIPKSLELRQRAREVMVAPTHLDRYFLPSTYPLFVKRGEGSRIIDADGNSYIDLAGGYGPHILGYAHPVVTKALGDAVASGNLNAVGHESEIELAELLVDAHPTADKVIFSNSGTEAVLHALRLARAYRRRSRVAKFEGQYHGFSDQGMVSSWFRFGGSKARPTAVAGTQGCHPGVVSDTLILQYGHPESIERIREDRDELACVICEPMPAAMASYNLEFLQALRAECTKWDIPLIYDEVVTGFRVAYGGAQVLSDVHPDLTCLGKIIGGGLPCGAVVGRRELIDMARTSNDPFVDYEKKAFVGGTLSGNHLTSVAGTAAVSYLRDNPQVYTELEQKTRCLANTLDGIAKRFEVPLLVKANRSIFSLTFSHRPAKFFRERISGSNFKATLALAYYMRKHGVYMPELHTMLISAAHTCEDLQEVGHAFERSLDEMVSSGFFAL
jgi:glutamate-1-semialdehyde 2,1-aminomutase